MQVFTGQHSVTLDSKGRIAIPAKMRQVAADQGSEKFYVTKGSHKNLDLYSEPGFEVKASLMKSHKAIETEREIYLRRKLFSNTEQCVPDKQGRILIAPHLRDYAGLDGEIIVTGVGESMEIWQKDAYDEYLRKQEEREEREKNRDSQREETMGKQAEGSC